MENFLRCCGAGPSCGVTCNASIRVGGGGDGKVRVRVRGRRKGRCRLFEF